MFWITGLILALAISQVPADLTKPEFIENVIGEESVTSERILSGWQAYPGQIPHQTSLRMVNSAGGVSGCGGSVVSRDWVITAAHCTALQITIVVRAGLVSLTTPQYIFETHEWYNHPTYNDDLPGVVQPNDISIMKLQRPVTYSRVLQPIRIQSSVEAHRNYDNEVVIASGFGRTWTDGAVSEVLNWVYLRAVSNAACQQIFGTALITDNAICARFYNVTSQSTCQGDSGGPLVHVDNDGVPILVGIASFVAGGNFGCHSGLPAGFIRTGPFLPWLEQVTGIDFENLNEEDVTTPEPEVQTTPEIETTQPESTPTTPAPETTEVTPLSTETAPQTTEVTPLSTETAPQTTEDTPLSTETAPQTTEFIPLSTEPAPETTELVPQTTEAAPQTTARPTTTQPPSTPEPEESEEESEEDSSSEEDPELSELLKKLIVKVKVKVMVNKELKRKVKVKCVDNL